MQPNEARNCFRRAVELSVDTTEAIYALLDLARTDKERKDELQFVERELIQQVVQGHGLLSFLELARPILEPEKLLSNLRIAHTERPDLWHAWSALVSQLRHLGQLDEARDLAQKATARFPHLPLVWLELATVHQWRGEADGEIQALERAFGISPAWSRSAITLAEALERHDRLEDARGVYQRALRHSPQDAQIHAFHGRLLWRLREQEAAFAAIEQALRLAPGYDWPWSMLMEWAGACGNPGRAEEFSRVLTRERPGEMRVWLMLARVLRDSAALSERLDAVAKAVELDPLSTEAWNLKAELLAGAECFNEAIRACQEGEEVCTSQVHILRGRRAWIEACRRQYPEAVRLMREVLAENSSYTWGWNQLAAWLVELGQIEEAAAAIEQLQRLCPRDPWVYRQLGFLRLKKKDQRGAREAFAKALRLAPGDVYSAQNIFDLQLQANDLQGAAATLRVMEIHQPGVRTLASQALLHLRAGEYSSGESAFEKLCVAPDPDPWPLEAVADALKRAGRAERANKILRDALKIPFCNPQAGAAYVRLCTSQKQAFRAVSCFMRFKPGELQRRAAAPLVQGLAQLQSRRLLQWLIWLRRDVLARDDAAWGWVGYACLNLKWRKKAIRWLSDWQSRANVEPWMVFNLCAALRHHGRYDEANALARYVLEHWEHREGSADMRLFLALEEALAGDVPRANEHLEKVVAREDSAYDLDLLALAKALVEFQQAPTAERPARFEAVRQKLTTHFTAGRLGQSMKDVRRSFRRTGRFLALNGGGWRARLWFARKLLW